MTLEQWWQQVHSCDNDNDEQNIVSFSKIVQREFNSIYVMQAEKDNRISHGGFWWFRTLIRNDGRKGSVGLSEAIMEKMRWLQEEGGWFNGEETEVRVEREEEIISESGWRRFVCYMLVESFNLRRMDGTLVLRWEFRHTHKIFGYNQSILKSSFPSEVSTLLGELPKETCLGTDLYNWEGFWYIGSHLSAIAARSNFQASYDDVILTSSMKTGTTWHPNNHESMGRTNDDTDHPLLKHNPNELMPSLEVQLFKENPNPDLSGMPSPRLFRSHVPYHMLPESVKNSACKIVYITRDPKDTFVSLWHFINSHITTMGKGPWPMNEAFESFYRGESLKSPEKILFLRYEDMKKDPKGQLKKLACFLGKPLAKEEEVDKVLWRCSLERLKNLEVNQHRVDPWLGIDYKFYFRNGNVGDWENNIIEEMKEKLDQVTAMKFEGSGLDFGHN
ncbi:hypothetical protein CRYUN_Cryun26dG0108500 [Craigia yunnanensis]